MRILIVVTSASAYESGLPTGLWLSELTHLCHDAVQQGHEVTIASTKGGRVPIDPESLKPLVLDKVTKAFRADPGSMALLERTPSLADVKDRRFDLVYLAGGHGTMYDFPDDTTLQAIIREQYERGGLVAAVCHGVGGLLNVKLSNEEHLIKGKRITGFNWFEESLALRKKEVPFNLEAALKANGADYRKAFIPMTSHVLVDENLITGQNPFSSKAIAKAAMQALRRRSPN